MSNYKEFQNMLDTDKRRISIQISKKTLIELENYMKSQGLTNRKAFLELLVYKFVSENKKENNL
jgi:metal-responsive CopG/Arc/MetJ family transcriptional regulator